MSAYSERNPYATQTKTLPAKGFGGLNEFYLRNRYGGNQAELERAAEEARKRGDLVGREGERVTDTWENRGMGRQRQAPRFAPPAGPTPDQLRWEKAARAKAEREAAAAAPQPTTPDPGTLGGAMSGSGLSTPSRAATVNPYTPNFSRAGNIANAKAAGEFDQIRKDYNAANAQRGMTMDEGGVIRTDPEQQKAFARSQLQPIADEIAARRDFARGEAPVSFTPSPNDPNADEMAPVRGEKVNPYGKATITYGGSKTQGTMKDPMGRIVPMAPHLADQSAVQDSKFGRMMESGARGPQTEYKFGATPAAPASPALAAPAVLSGTPPPAAPATPTTAAAGGSRFGQMMSAKTAAGEDGGALGAKDAQDFKQIANGGAAPAMADAGGAPAGEVADTGDQGGGGGDEGDPTGLRDELMQEAANAPIGETPQQLEQRLMKKAKSSRPDLFKGGLIA